ncbi:MAG: DNA polymerase III subunit beta [Bacteroidales bacterium]|nr:DNA polymerase III subunit beta [Bacteroidales bacterium]MBR5778737.1 DNA polymerase III subunit beta [Bacteroidales bacterium]
MKFIINSQVFSKNLQALSGVINNNNTVAILNCFHFRLEENVLTIRATDLETTLVSTIHLDTAKVEGISEVAVPAKILLDILKSFNDIPLTFSVNPDNYLIDIVAGEGKYHLAGQNPETYPVLKKAENTTKIVLPASVLVNAISKTSFATSNDEMRQQMSGIYCEMNSESLTFVGTDAHKLVRYRRFDVVSDENSSFILPKKPIGMVKNIILMNKEDVDVVVEYNSTNVFFSFDNFYIICRLVDGKYPNYEAAIPKENPNKLIINRSEFLTSLRRVSIFANQSTLQVRLLCTEKELIISSEDIENSNDAKEKIACEYEGDQMEIGFNAKFLIEMVNNIDTENVMMELAHPSRAGILFPVNEEDDMKENILMLVMPVMLNVN